MKIFFTISLSIFTQIIVLASDVVFKEDKKTLSMQPDVDIKSFLKDKNFFSRSNFEYLLDSRVIVNSEVETLSGTNKGQQKMRVTVAGIHGKTCAESSVILAQYEKYKQFISFVKSSDYRDGKVYLTIKADPIPVQFGLDLKIDRLKEPGIYPFLMGLGIFEGMTGEVHFYNYLDPLSQKKKCFYYADAVWQGKDTGYPDLLMETFTSAIAKKGLERLFIISGHQPKD